MVDRKDKEEAGRMLRLLEERLVKHDENRREVQEKLQRICSKAFEEANSFEEGVSERISKAFVEAEERILGLIEELNSKEEEGGGGGGGAVLSSIMERVQEELKVELKCEIVFSESAESFADAYKIEVASVRVEDGLSSTGDETNKAEAIVSLLENHLDRTHKAMDTGLERLREICAKRRSEAEEMKKRINEKLEPLFSQEDARIRDIVKMIKEKIDSATPDELKELGRKAKVALVLNQKYSLSSTPGLLSLEECDLVTTKDVSLECIDFTERAPSSVTASFTGKGNVSLSFSFFGPEEVEILNQLSIEFCVEVEMVEKGCDEETCARAFTKPYGIGDASPISICEVFSPSTTYLLKTRVRHLESWTKWSEEAEFATPEFEESCVWKECPEDVDEKRKYSVDERSPRIATKIGDIFSKNDHCTIVGGTSLPRNTVTSWNIKILKSENDNGSNIHIGVASFDIDQNKDDNFYNCGWYLDCFDSKLYSGPPHGYRYRSCGQRKEEGEYVHTGDSVGVVMDTAKGDLSFVLNGVNLGVAYEGIPLDKPLVPCVILWFEGDSVELDISEVKENVDSSITIPSNITAKSITWDSITFTWDAVEGASFYQIEVDGSGSFESPTESIFVKKKLPPNTEHSFRVRTVRENSVSKWSDIITGRTQKESFKTSVWRECPKYVDLKKGYFVDRMNQRIASNAGSSYCTVVGGTRLPPSQATSWCIKMLHSRYNGHGIFVGVAPFDINQNCWNNFEKCGWYFYCYDSTLFSGPPHDYNGEGYGLIRKSGEYVLVGESVEVTMDTESGELSFALNGMNLGVAFEEIPLDRPLVPCVIIHHRNDSVELVIN